MRERESYGEEQRHEVSVSERPAAVPVRVTAHRDEKEERAGKAKREVGPVLAAAPPAQETGNRPREEGREKKHAARGMKEVVQRDPRARIAHAHGLTVLSLDQGKIAQITSFLDTSLFAHFGLPRTLPD